MGLITSADLTWMQGIQERALPGTVVIERATINHAALGTETWLAVGTAIGRVYPQNTRSFNEPVMGERVTSEGRWFATLPTGTDVIAADRLLYASRTFEVIRVNNDESWMTAVRCECVSHNEERRA
jgi:head-tail adaptor